MCKLLLIVAVLTGGGNLTLQGTGLDQDGASVYIGSEKCEIIESSSTEIICKLPSAEAKQYSVKVAFEDLGYADG